MHILADDVVVFPFFICGGVKDLMLDSHISHQSDFNYHCTFLFTRSCRVSRRITSQTSGCVTCFPFLSLYIMQLMKQGRDNRLNDGFFYQSRTYHERKLPRMLLNFILFIILLITLIWGQLLDLLDATRVYIVV